MFSRTKDRLMKEQTKQKDSECQYVNKRALIFFLFQKRFQYSANKREQVNLTFCIVLFIFICYVHVMKKTRREKKNEEEI